METSGALRAFTLMLTELSTCSPLLLLSLVLEQPSSLSLGVLTTTSSEPGGSFSSIDSSVGLSGNGSHFSSLSAIR